MVDLNAYPGLKRGAYARRIDYVLKFSIHTSLAHLTELQENNWEVEVLNSEVVGVYDRDATQLQ